MKRSTARTAAVGAVMVLGSLTGCGGSDGGSGEGSSSGDYCSAVEAAKAQFDDLETGNFAGFEEAFDALRGLADQAPTEVAAQWEVIVGGLDQIQGAIEDAGFTLEEFGAYVEDPANPPPDIDVEALNQLGTELQDLDSAAFTEASDAITKHAQDECGVDLEDSGSETPPTE